MGVAGKESRSEARELVAWVLLMNETLFKSIIFKNLLMLGQNLFLIFISLIPDTSEFTNKAVYFRSQVVVSYFLSLVPIKL